MRRERILFTEVLSTETKPDGKVERKVLIGKVGFTQGGYSYFDYKTHPRGYFLDVSVERQEDVPASNGIPAGVVSIRQLCGAAQRSEMIQAAQRFSQKTLDTLTPPPGKVSEFKAYVMERAGTV